MRERWKYLFVTDTYSSNFVTKTESEPAVSTHQITIEEIQEKDRPKPKLERIVAPKGTTLLSVFSGLGNRGWELVSETVMETTIVGTAHGWRSVGIPAVTRFMFKRRVSDDRGESRSEL
jgi:hypothetical protein